MDDGGERWTRITVQSASHSDDGLNNNPKPSLENRRVGPDLIYTTEQETAGEVCTPSL